MGPLHASRDDRAVAPARAGAVHALAAAGGDCPSDAAKVVVLVEALALPAPGDGCPRCGAEDEIAGIGQL